MFDYQPGASFLNYQNMTFVPNYLDEANQTLRSAAEALCGGASNIQCVFDKVFTGSDSIATETKTIVVDEKEIKTILGNC